MHNFKCQCSCKKCTWLLYDFIVFRLSHKMRCIAREFCQSMFHFVHPPTGYFISSATRTNRELLDFHFKKGKPRLGTWPDVKRASERVHKRAMDQKWKKNSAKHVRHQNDGNKGVCLILKLTGAHWPLNPQNYWSFSAYKEEEMCVQYSLHPQGH